MGKYIIYLGEIQEGEGRFIKNGATHHFLISGAWHHTKLQTTNTTQACKPGSVSTYAKHLSRLATADDDHLSRPDIAAKLMQPTRPAVSNGPFFLARPI